MLNRTLIEQAVALLSQPRRVQRRGQTVELPPAIAVEGDEIAFAQTAQAERDIARHIARIQAGVAARGPLTVPPDAFGAMQPDDSQRAAVETAAATGAMVLTGGPGCVSGDTELLVETDARRGSGGRKVRVADAFWKFHNLRRPGKGGTKFWRGVVRTLSLMPDGGIAYNVIQDIKFNGHKEVFNLRTAAGRSIRLTADHPVKVPEGTPGADEEGFSRLEQLRPGMQIVVRRDEATSCKRKGRNTQHRRELHVPHHPKARSKRVRAVSNRTTGERTTYTYLLVREARLVIEASMNAMSFDAYVERLQTAETSIGLKFLPLDVEIHHIDGDVANNTIENLVALTKEEHARQHGTENRLHFGQQQTETDTITSIVSAGIEPVYDLVMTDPARNYIANGIVVHNCGKTTVTKAILAVYEAAGLQPVCCAPTGKAALRMSEQTGRGAATIHQTLGLRPGAQPKHHAGEPLSCGVLVVDESSMIETSLFAQLVAAVPTGARLLIVGDVDQLPSIGPGRVLFDLIHGGGLGVARLTKIHRQASESRIPYFARDINEGRTPDLTVQGTDVTHWETESEQEILDRVLGAVDAIPQRKGISADKIQVIAAQYGDESRLGIVALNLALQRKLNGEPGQDDVPVARNYTVRAGDRVIQTANNYTLGVMNGEQGRVVDSDPNGLPVTVETWRALSAAEEDIEASPEIEHLIEAGKAHDLAALVPDLIGTDRHGVARWKQKVLALVEFNGGSRTVAYTAQTIRQLELGYCVSVHKSQGSQWDAVIVVAPKAHAWSLTRALLYTAVTRAAKFVLTVGPSEQIAKSIQNTRGMVRRTKIRDRLDGR